MNKKGQLLMKAESRKNVDAGSSASACHEGHTGAMRCANDLELFLHEPRH